MAAVKSVEEYLGQIPPAQRKEYERIRGIVLDIVPDANETISYGMPTFTHKGKYVLYFGAFKDHMSIFPGAALTAAVKNKLTGFKLAKGTVQFTHANPVPEAIIRELVTARLHTLQKSGY